jgi:hypothetical protein
LRSITATATELSPRVGDRELNQRTAGLLATSDIEPGNGFPALVLSKATVLPETKEACLAMLRKGDCANKTARG